MGLAQDLKILPEYLNSLGYSSHLLGRWSQGFCSKEYLPTQRGFSTFYGTWTDGGDHQNHLSSADPKSSLTSLGYDFHEDESISLGNIGYSTVDLMVDKFSSLLRKLKMELRLSSSSSLSWVARTASSIFAGVSRLAGTGLRLYRVFSFW